MMSPVCGGWGWALAASRAEGAAEHCGVWRSNDATPSSDDGAAGNSRGRLAFSESMCNRIRVSSKPMSVSGSETITINAPLADVLAIIRDLDGQPSWFPGNVSTEVLETDADGLPTKARLVNDVKVAKDEFELTYTNTDTSMSWSLVAPSKAQKEQDGSWSLADKGATTEATMSLTIDSALPLPGFMQKKVLKDTLKGATQALKKRAES